MDESFARQAPESTDSAADAPPAGEVDTLRRAFLRHLFYTQAKFPAIATPHDCYRALAFAVRDRMLQRWISTAAEYTRKASRTVAYLSAEFLTGPHLGNNLVCLGLYDDARRMVGELGLDFEALIAEEAEPGLGNGGLGRLAACFMDSMATLELPAIGYGIRYEFGIFRQAIENAAQVEKTDTWLAHGNPWEIQRPEWAVTVGFGGHTEHHIDAHGRARVRWVPERTVTGTPYDTPVPGYRNHTANTLRLWRADASEVFDLSVFNRGDFHGAVNQQVHSENLSRVLYPTDATPQGKALRLEQQYFFVACSLRDMLRIMRTQRLALDRLPEKFAVQLNDTHPAIGIAELMRLLVDEHAMPWERAWDITGRTFAYTNHTLLPEALERWSVPLFGQTLPRHLEIIYDINAQHLTEVARRFPDDATRVAALSLIDEDGERHVRMAHLACVGSHAINGVAALHTELLKTDVLAGFHALWPERFTNKTNGVTPRRWLMLANPRLSRLITDAIGPAWTLDLDALRALEPLADDAALRSSWGGIRRANKRDLARLLKKRTGVAVDPDSLFDVQVKRIHEYKRQHLCALYAVALYQRLKTDPHFDPPPRTIIFGGKAAPSYFMAKLIIRLINGIAEVVNRDPGVRNVLKVLFVPDFNVSTGQVIYPGADLSEQVSTAGKEASGTGNMKFQMNGALTIGTLDGANIEIREQVGAENFFLFGLTASQVADLHAGGYQPHDYIEASPTLREVLALIESGVFSRGDTQLFAPLLENLRGHDPFLVLADFDAYLGCQQSVDSAFRDRQAWLRRSVLNTARSGFFSSDRSIRDYARDIWHTDPVPVRLMNEEDIRPEWMW